MGGVKEIQKGKPLEPDTANNNTFDMKSAEFFYQRCQELGVQLIILTRHAAYKCPVRSLLLVFTHPLFLWKLQFFPKHS